MRIFNALVAPVLLCVPLGCSDSTDDKAVEEKLKKLTSAATQAAAKHQDKVLHGFRMQIRGLKSSLAAKEFPDARKHAEKIDEFLGTKIVTQSVEFLRVESVEGAKAAKSAIADYMAENDLGQAELEACNAVLEHIDAMDKKELAGLVSAIVYIALERKMSHSAAIPATLAGVLVEELAGAGSAPTSGPASAPSP